MADGRHVGKCSKCQNSPTNGPTGTQLGCSHPIMFSTCPPCCGSHGNSRCLATAHWTFWSYGRLEAERVNQFRWILVHDSMLGPQWQSRDQILKFSIFKMADGRHVGKYWVVASHHVPNIGNAITPLTMEPIGTTLGWARPNNTSAAKPFPWYWSLLLTTQWTF